jgi:hypothetical protein
VRIYQPTAEVRPHDSQALLITFQVVHTRTQDLAAQLHVCEGIAAEQAAYWAGLSPGEPAFLACAIRMALRHLPSAKPQVSAHNSTPQKVTRPATYTRRWQRSCYCICHT